MALFNFLKGNDSFVSENRYKKNIAKQREMNKVLLKQFNTMGISEDSSLKLEFFFYTDQEDKANNLAIELHKLNYNIEKAGTSAGKNKLYVVTGWSTKLKMDLINITNWTTHMCELGYKCDCDFDGWGTFPDQDEE